MVDLEVLSKLGVSADGWKEKFTGDRHSRSEKVNAFIDRIRCKIQAGRDLNLDHYQVYWSMDEAIDAAYKQITPTLVSTLVGKEGTMTSDDLMKTIKSWGIDPNEVLKQLPDNKDPKKMITQVIAPAFTKVTVPLVLAYLKIRWAKIVNDRKMVPLFKYEPVISDEISRLKCDVLTSRVEAMSRQYGYFDTMKQVVFHTLHYGDAVQFVQEEWDVQCQLVEAESALPGEPVSTDAGNFKKVIVKEGLRYHIPHPSRRYMDRAYPPSSLNTDSGVKHLGYWRVNRYSDVMNTAGYYNLETIGFEDFQKWFSGKHGHSYWTNVLGGCAINFPDSKNVEGAGGSYDTEKHIAKWYSKDMGDKPIVICEHFEKIIPSQCGLGDYDYPVWGRFVMAADDQVIYAAPLAYIPATWYGYDFIEGRTHNVSMTLEVLPFQDQFTNLLTQLLFTTRQNLANLSFVDTDLVGEEDMKKISNLGEMWYRGINIIKTSFRKIAQKMGSNPTTAVISHKFPQGDINSIVQSMNIVLDTLERILVMSSQELGQSASHEQTREEVRHIAQNTSTRVEFTATGIAVGLDAWKRQIYHALMASGQMPMWAQVPMDQPIDKATLEKLGFTVAGDWDPKTRKQYLHVENKTALAFESFSSDRDGNDRINDAATAATMIQMLDKIVQNPNLFPAVGADQCINIINQICRFLDFPRDFKIVNTGQTQTMVDEMKGALGELTQQMKQQYGELTQDIQGAMKEMTLKNKEQDVTLHEVTSKVNLILGESAQIESPQTSSPSELDTFPAMAGA